MGFLAGEATQGELQGELLSGGVFLYKITKKHIFTALRPGV